MSIISTVNIGLKFDVVGGTPTLENIEKMLKSIRSNAKEPINLKVTSEINQDGTSIKTASKKMAEFRNSIPTNGDKYPSTISFQNSTSALKFTLNVEWVL